METKTIPLRQDVNPADCWNLSKLYKSFEEWNNAFNFAKEQTLDRLEYLKKKKEVLASKKI